MTWRHLRGSASFWLAAVSVVVMVLLSFTPDLFDRVAISAGFIPLRFDVHLASEFYLLPPAITPLTGAFIHDGLGALIFPVLILLAAGSTLEKAVGKTGLLLIFLLGVYAAASTEYFLRGHSIIPILGSYGAVSAILGASALAYGKIKRVVSNYYADVAIHALSLLAFWVVLQWIMGWLSGSPEGQYSAGALSVSFLAGLLAYFPLQHTHWVKKGSHWEALGSEEDAYRKD